MMEGKDYRIYLVLGKETDFFEETLKEEQKSEAEKSGFVIHLYMSSEHKSQQLRLDFGSIPQFELIDCKKRLLDKPLKGGN
jgi:hypothetical protein